MCIKKIIIFLSFIILLSSFVYADLNTGFKTYLSGDDTSTDSAGYNNGTLTGVTYSSSIKKLGNASFDMTGASDYISVDGGKVGGLVNKTISMWVYHTTLANTQFYWAQLNAIGTHSGMYKVTGTNLVYLWANGGDISTTYTPPLNTWYNVMVTTEVIGSARNETFYVNGVYKFSRLHTSSVGTTTFRFGANHVGAEDAKGYFDSIMIWDRPLEASEALEVWNNGTGLTYDNIAGPYQINTTLATQSISYPTSEWDVNVSLEGEWNETATCTINYTSSNIYCTQPEDTINMNETLSFTCFTDGSVNSADLYVQCSSPASGVINSDTAVYTFINRPSINDEIIACYDFDEQLGTNVPDYYDNHNGTAISSPTWVSGKIGNALDFETSLAQRVDITNHNDLNVFDELTIAYWVNYETLVGVVLDKGFSNGCGLGGGCNPYRAGDMTATIENFGSYSSTYGWKNVNYKTFTTGTWEHVITNWNSSHITVWKNNVQVGQTVFTNAIDTNTQPLNLGAYWAGSAYTDYLDGKIDLLQIWNRTLSEDERVVLYNDDEGLTCELPDVNSMISVDWNTTTIYTDNNTNTFYYNLTNIASANCTLYFNDTIEDTQNNRVGNISYSFEVTKTGTIDEIIPMYISCIDNSDSTVFYSAPKYVEYNISGVSVITNLSTSSISLPTLSFDTIVSLEGEWNETATCSIIDDAAWVSCLPSTADLNTSNSTVFTCTATERNTGAVNIYAQCDGTINPLVNSTSYVYTITADSNPIVQSNLSSSYDLFLLESLPLNITGYNWTEQPTACNFLLNDTGLTCVDTGLESDGAYQYSNITSCTPDYIQEKDYDININCTGTIYENISSPTYTVTIDADSNPSIIANFTNLSTSIDQTFDTLVTGTNFYESTINCVFVWDDPVDNAECPAFNITANQTNPSYTVVTCTEAHSESKLHEVYVECNGTLYNNITSPIYTVVHDNIYPEIEQISPKIDNTSFKNTTEDFRFEFTCSHPFPVSISNATVSCVNETDDIVYTAINQTTLNSFTFNETTDVFNYVNNFQCDMTCTDSTGHTNSSTANITVVEALTDSSTNLSSYIEVKDTFDVSINFDFGSDPATCTIIGNETTAVSCTSPTGLSPLVSTCSPLDSVESYLTFHVECNNTVKTFINLTGPESQPILLDIVLPRITVNNPPSTGTGQYLNISPVDINISFYDPNLFAYNVTCYNKSTGEVHYSVQQVNISVENYNITDSVSFPYVGIEECNATAADGHTDNKYDADVDIKTKKLGIGNDKLVITKKDKNGDKKDKTKIEIVWDKKSDVEIDDISFDKKTDRISPYFHTRKPGKPVFCHENATDPGCVDADNTYVNIYWEVKFDYKIINREDTSGIPGHIIMIPDNNFNDAQWYDAIDEYNDSIVSMDVKNKKVDYHLMIPYREYYKDGGEIVKTKSIGGLNVNTEIWNFTILNSKTVTFNAYNIYNGSTINTFNITVDNSTDQVEYSTTNGTIEIPVGSTNLTLDIIAPDNYLNNYTISSYNANLSSSYNLSFWEATLNITVVNIQDLSPVAGVTITVKNDSTTLVNTSNPSLFYLNLNTYDLNASALTIVDNSTNYTISTKGNYQYTFEMFSSFIYNLMDEATKVPFNMSSPDTVTQYTYCTDTRVVSEVLASNVGALSVECTYEKIKFVVDYPTDRYYRTLLPRAINISEGNLTVWLVNLDTTQIVFNTFEVYSLVEEFVDLKVYFKKFIDEEEYIITSDFIDVESKIGTYLMLSEEYTVEVEADNLATRNMGFYSADTTGDKILRLFEIDFNADITGYYENNSWWLSTDNSTTPNRAKVTYLSEDVATATLNVYNETNDGSLLYSSTIFSDTGIMYYLPETQHENYSFIVELDIVKDAGTSEDVKFNKDWRAQTKILLDIITFGYITEEWLGLFLILLLSVLSLIFSYNTADIGGLIYVGLAGFFVYIGWMYVGSLIIGLSLIIGIINFLKKKDMGRL